MICNVILEGGTAMYVDDTRESIVRNIEAALSRSWPTLEVIVFNTEWPSGSFQRATLMIDKIVAVADWIVT